MHMYWRPPPVTVIVLSLLSLAFFFAGSSAWAREKGRASWTAGVHHRAPPSRTAQRIVKVSLSSRTVYVMEGDRSLLVAPTCSGKLGHLTPTGVFRVTGKAKRRRSGKYGFWVKDGQAVEGTKSAGPPSRAPGWKFVGYPMPFWVGFSPGYGFHEGYLWSTPRTHGCLHLTGRDAERFFALIDRGTLISIRQTQPEDQSLGKGVPHPMDEAAPDPPSSFFLSDESFTTPWEDARKPESAKPSPNLGREEPNATTRKEPERGKNQENGTAAPAARPS
ncbi:L,D-transpeptidase [Verrucomicrobium sp. 3C]|uniref:L,D-transpeptidase n=1 Tax=Verrucomicrobium sp. 3C TaxID=1134055 RepID=UPI0018CBBD08|nr:L,D-transpeptidase [Verrucomicrobium sp. 3C]